MLEAYAVVLAQEATVDGTDSFDPVDYLRTLRDPVPVGRILVHNHVQPLRILRRNGFRAWHATPDDTQYELFRGVVAPAPAWVPLSDRRGTEHIRPEDTHDVDYGSLLERCYGKGVASPAGTDTLWTFERRRLVRVA